DRVALEMRRCVVDRVGGELGRRTEPLRLPDRHVQGLELVGEAGRRRRYEWGAELRRLALVAEGGIDAARRSGADAGAAGVGARTAVAVVARGTLGLRGIRADGGQRIADADVVTLIERAARDRVVADADAALARVRLRARGAVVARRGVGLGGARGGRARARV